MNGVEVFKFEVTHVKQKLDITVVLYSYKYF